MKPHIRRERGMWVCGYREDGEYRYLQGSVAYTPKRSFELFNFHTQHGARR